LYFINVSNLLHRYVECNIKGEETVKLCPDGLVFDIYTQNCDYPAKVDCSLRPELRKIIKDIELAKAIKYELSVFQYQILLDVPNGPYYVGTSSWISGFWMYLFALSLLYSNWLFSSCFPRIERKNWSFHFNTLTFFVHLLTTFEASRIFWGCWVGQ